MLNATRYTLYYILSTKYNKYNEGKNNNERKKDITEPW